MADEQEKEGLQRLDSEPPEPGDDAYDGPTKVGQISSAVWKAAQPVRPPLDTLETGPPSNTDDTPPNGTVVPQTYDSEEEDHDGATLLHPGAKPFSLPPPRIPPRVTASAPLDMHPPPPMEPRVPEMVGPGPNDKAWPFAPALIDDEAPGDRKQAIVVALAAAIFGVIAAVLIWRWLL